MKTYLKTYSRISSSDSGTSGFFEEIILFAVVSILFVATLTMAAYYGSIKAEEYAKVEFVNQVYDFVQKVRGYEPILHDSVEGLFDHYKLKYYDSTELHDMIARDLAPAFNFYINITDASDYPERYNASFGTPYNITYGYYKVVVIYPVNIWYSDHEIHSARLEVIAWK